MKKDKKTITESDILESEKLKKFINSKPSIETRDKYKNFCKDYFLFVNEAPDTYFIENYEFLPTNKKMIYSKKYKTDLGNFRIKLMNEPNAQGRKSVSSSIRTQLSCIRSLFTYCEIDLSIGFWKQWNNFKNTRAGIRQTPTHEQIAKILDHLTLQGKIIALLEATTGSRSGSIIKLQRKHITLGDEYPTIRFTARTTKSNRPMIKKTTPETGRLLESYFNEHKFNPEDYIFPGRTKIPTPHDKHKYRMIEDRKKPMTRRNYNDMFTRAIKKAELYEKNDETGQSIMPPHTFKNFFRSKASKGSETLSRYFADHSGLDATYKNLSDKDLSQEYAKISPHLLIYEKPVDTDMTVKELKKEIEKLNGKLKYASDSARENQEAKMQYIEQFNRLDAKIQQIEENVKTSFTNQHSQNLAYKLLEQVINNAADLTPEQKQEKLSHKQAADYFFETLPKIAQQENKSILEIALEITQNPDKIDEILATKIPLAQQKNQLQPRNKKKKDN